MHTFLLVTSKCNETCKYCDFPSMKSPNHYSFDNIDWDEIKRILHYYQKYNHKVTIVGGEPGALSYDSIKYIFDLIPDMEFDVLTNGLFLQKNYHTEFSNQIGNIGFHLVNTEWDLSEYKDIKNIDYRVVIDNSYPSYLDDLLKYIEFYKLPVIFKYDTGRVVDGNFNLTKEQYIDIYSKIKDNPYISKKSKKRAQYLISEKQTQYYKQCTYTKSVVTSDLCIDLVENVIKPCFATYAYNHNDFALKLETIYQLLTNPLDLKGLPCKQCTGYEDIPAESISVVLSEVRRLKAYMDSKWVG